MSGLGALLGRAAWLEISDPWDFGSACGTGPFSVEIADSGSGALLLTLRSRLQYRDQEFDHVVATARHAATGLSAMMTGGIVPVNLVPVVTCGEDAGAAEWMKTAAAWRGWGLVGTLRTA